MVKVNYDDLESAFQFVCSSAPAECNAYISLDTGQIHWVSDLADVEEAPPEDVETSDRYIAVPHKNDMNLGRNLVTRFVRQALPDSEVEVDALFRRRGGYGRFKGFLDSKGQLKQWYQFEESAQEKALREWCAENEIEIVEKPRRTSAQDLPIKPKIRHVTTSDATAVCAIYNPYVLDTVVTFEQTPVSESEMAKRIKEYIALYPWLVAEVDAKVVAYAYATRWRTRAAYDYTLESTIYVDKNYTGRGIARPLYLELLRELKARKVHAVVGCIALPQRCEHCAAREMRLCESCTFSAGGAQV